MSSKQEVRSELHFMFVLLLLVAVAAVPVFLSFHSDEKDPVVVEVKHELPVREPASQPEVVGANTKAATLHVGCKKEVQQQEVSSNYVRIEGAPCASTDSIQIVNQSNGFSASVFFNRDNSYTTDFIDLSEGDNELKLNIANSDGTQTQKTVHVSRRIPASNAPAN
jgi:hypothetical protein